MCFNCFLAERIYIYTKNKPDFYKNALKIDIETKVKKGETSEFLAIHH